jgi:hypothetical protein
MRYLPWIIEEDPRLAAISREVIINRIQLVRLVLQESPFDIRHRVVYTRSWSRSNPKPAELDIVYDNFESRIIVTNAGWSRVNWSNAVIVLRSGERYKIEIRWPDFRQWFRDQAYRYLRMHQPRQPKELPPTPSIANIASATVNIASADVTVHRPSTSVPATAAEPRARPARPKARATINQPLRNATDADRDACIEALAAETDGKTDRGTIRKKGPEMLKRQGIRSTASALEIRFQEDVHKDKRRTHGERRNA